MMYLKYGIAGAAALALLLSIAPASAQQPPRVRGTIEKIDGNTLTVKSRDGSTVNVVLKDGAAVRGVESIP